MTKKELTEAIKELLIEYLHEGRFDDAQLDELTGILAGMIDDWRDSGWEE